MLQARAEPFYTGGRKRIFVLAGSALLLAIAVIAGIAFSRRAPPAPAILTIRPVPFSVQLPESGVVQYPQIQTLSARVAATLGQVFVKPGQRVSAGQLLATLENPQILSAAQSTGAAYRSANAKASSVQVTGGANVIEAQANLETARARLEQARQDLTNGLQSGLGYGNSTASDLRAQAQASLITATATWREARRLLRAYRDLYRQGAVSLDQLDQTQAKYDQAKAEYDQATLQRSSLDSQLTRSRAVLQDNLRSAQQAYAQAQAQLAAARLNSGAGDVAAAQAQAAQAASEYDFATQQADALQIRAPYAATVLSVATEKADPLRPLQAGDAVDAGSPIVTIAAKTAFVVRTKVDEQDVIAVRPGQRAIIAGEDFPHHTLSGRVTDISPVAMRSGDAPGSSRTVPVTIAIDGAPPFLRDGMTVDVNILTTQLARAIVVPNEAIGSDAAGTYVYLMHEGRVRRQPVTAGTSNNNASVITSGLHPGDAVLAQTSAVRP
ncbi:MAG TPA: efflux RND transporter periplasmic adaptor subunit [Candidatus Baltobacteraceae bacterium]|nr:efflux RND transporter periplasmic adaptor subunit [Candidatus Baltobacteraceae bacterium]